MDVVILAGEELVRPHLDLHQGVPGRAAAQAGATFATQAQDLLVPGARGNGHVDGATLGHGDALGRSVHGLQEFDGKPVEDVLSPHPHSSTPGASAEHLPQDVLRFCEVGEAAAGAVGMRLGTGALEIAVVTLTRALRAGGVDLAAIVACALLRIANQVVGRRDCLEFLLRCPVARIEVGMQRLGELAVGSANLVRRGLLLHAQDGIGILAHEPLLI